MCGEFAVDVFSQTCGSTGKQCTDLVVDPSNYHDAYWEIKYISVFTKCAPATPFYLIWC